MASTISAGITTTTALSYSADTSGVLQLQTNGGTTALTLDTSQNATFAGKVASASSLQLATNGTTTAVTIDTNQNVGIGVTPDSIGSNWKALELANGIYLASYTGSTNADMYLGCNNYWNGTAYIGKVSGYNATQYEQYQGQHRWWNTNGSNVTGGSSFTFTQAMTLDASGNVQLGLTTNPQSSRLTVQGAASSIADFESTITTTSGGGIRVSNSGTTELWMGYYQFASNMGAGVTDAGLSARNNLLLDGTNAILFGINGTEKARIDTSGNLLVGTTSANGSRLSVVSTGTTSASYVFIGQNSALTNEMTVRSDGVGFLNASAWVYSSDATLKENITYLNPTDCLNILSNAKPVKFDYIDGQKQNYGYLAQEVQTWLPESVSENPNEKLGLQDGFINVLSTGAILALKDLIQELSAQVTTLQSQVTALKG